MQEIATNLHELVKKTIIIIRVNSCNSWRKIVLKFKTVNLSILTKKIPELKSPVLIIC